MFREVPDILSAVIAYGNLQGMGYNFNVEESNK